MESLVERSKIIEEARSWIGTRYHHQQCVKGVGCDCVGLVRACGNLVGIKYVEDWNYARTPDPPTMLRLLDKYLVKKSVTTMKPGDVICFRVQEDPCHLAIFTGTGIIHAYAKTVKKVIEQELTPYWLERIVRVYKFPGID